MLLTIGIALSVVAFIIYLWLTWNYNFWKTAGVLQLQPELFYGNTKDVINMKKNLGLIYDDIYWQYPDEPAVGMYKLRQPQLLVRDAEMLKTMLIKEFNCFHDNDFSIDPSSDPIISLNPFFIRGEKWKTIRAITSSALTGSKLKGMALNVKNVCKDLVDYLEKQEDQYLEAKYLGGQFTTDVVTGCVYGLVSNSFKDPNSIYRQMITGILVPETKSNFRLMIIKFLPQMASLLKLRFISKKVADFFINIASEAVDYRKKHSIERNDYLQQLINEKDEHGNPVYSMTEIAAHSLTFVADGYETSSILISHILDLLSQNQEIQSFLRTEIQSKIKCLDDIDFENAQSCPYLDAVVNETLRMRPPATLLLKVCTKNVTISSHGKTYPIKKGVSIAVPVYSIHTDPKYFEDPDVFMPERFLNLNSNPLGFMPFGLGPRACLGIKFALMQVKAAILSIVLNFEVIPKEIQNGVPEFDEKSTLLLMKKGGVWVKFKSLK